MSDTPPPNPPPPADIKASLDLAVQEGRLSQEAADKILANHEASAPAEPQPQDPPSAEAPPLYPETIPDIPLPDAPAIQVVDGVVQVDMGTQPGDFLPDAQGTRTPATVGSLTGDITDLTQRCEDLLWWAGCLAGLAFACDLQIKGIWTQVEIDQAAEADAAQRQAEANATETTPDTGV